MGKYPVYQPDGTINTDNAKVYFDIKDGKAFFKGKIEADSGSFNGAVTATDFYFKNGDSVKTLLGGAEKLEQIPNDAVNFYALNILNKQTQQPTFQIDTNGNVKLSGTINWNKTNSDPISLAAKEAADGIANGTYKGGTFIDGTKIYSPEIYTQMLTVNNSASGGDCGFDLRWGDEWGSASVFHILYDANSEAINNIRIGTELPLELQLWVRGNYIFSGGFATEKSTIVNLGGPIYLNGETTFSGKVDFSKASIGDIDCHKLSAGTGGVSFILYDNNKTCGIASAFERIFRRLKTLDNKTDSIFDYV